MSSVSFVNVPRRIRRFVKQQKEQASRAGSFDAEKCRRDWIAAIDDLYAQVEGFIASYAKRGDIEVSFRPLKVSEDIIGAYETRRMKLKIGLKEVTLEPIGRLIIGAMGRVDLVGPGGTAKIVRVDKKLDRPSTNLKVYQELSDIPTPLPSAKGVDLAWKFSAHAPERRYDSLTRNSFLSAVMEVANA